MPGLDKQGRALLALANRTKAHQSWALTRNRAERTAKARAAMLGRFEREAREFLGPNASEQQVQENASARRKAYYSALAYELGQGPLEAKRELTP